jgi:hypothetical protein
MKQTKTLMLELQEGFFSGAIKPEVFKAAWEKAGKPSDVANIAKILKGTGLKDAQIQKALKSIGVDWQPLARSAEEIKNQNNGEDPRGDQEAPSNDAKTGDRVSSQGGRTGQIVTKLVSRLTSSQKSQILRAASRNLR